MQLLGIHPLVLVLTLLFLLQLTFSPSSNHGIQSLGKMEIPYSHTTFIIPSSASSKPLTPPTCIIKETSQLVSVLLPSFPFICFEFNRCHSVRCKTSCCFLIKPPSPPHVFVAHSKENLKSFNDLQGPTHHAPPNHFSEFIS